MRVSLIAAIGEHRELGNHNTLLWHIPGELQRFKEITMGNPIIMGRKTHESIGRVLPGRTNIIISRDSAYQIVGARTVHSLQKALVEAKKEHPHEIFIIGGGQIFEQALDTADRLYLTVVHKTFAADVYFPPYSEFTKIIEKKDMQGPAFAYTFLTLEKEPFLTEK